MKKYINLDLYTEWYLFAYAKAAYTLFLYE